MATILTGKRKRNQVSYLEDDDNELDAVLAADDAADAGALSDEDDTTFGSRKKTKPKKKPKTTRKSKAREQKSFRFLDLPAELRDEIYDLAFTDPDGLAIVSRSRNHRQLAFRGSISIRNTPSYHGSWRSRHRSWPYYSISSKTTTFGIPSRTFIPSLLAVNQQIREEGSSVLYKQEFVFEDTRALHIFLAKIGHYNRQLISEVTVMGYGNDGAQRAHNYAAFSMLSTCINLQSLFIDTTLWNNADWKRLATQIFRDGHHFLESMSSTHGSYDAAVDIIELSEQNFDGSKSYRYRELSDSERKVMETDHRKKFAARLKKLLESKR